VVMSYAGGTHDEHTSTTRTEAVRLILNAMGVHANPSYVLTHLDDAQTIVQTHQWTDPDGTTRKYQARITVTIDHLVV
jgi:hypothetical protein